MKSFTQSDALIIANKLDATIDTKRKAHDRAIVYCDGVRVAEFGIRRGSRELGHGHLPRNLDLSRKQTVELARCQLSKDDYFAIWRAKNPD